MSMLTIKHIEKSGHESVQQARDVAFQPGDKDAEMKLTAFGCTAHGGAVDDSGVCLYATGRIFVMNDAGATVASYDFS